MITLVLLAAMTFAQDAPKTGFWIEEQTTVVNDVVTPQIDGILWHNFNGTLGAYGWFQASERYSQVYAGPTMRLYDWIQVGAGIGMEDTDTPFRIGSFVAVNKDDVSFSAVYETSASNYWYKAELNIAASDLVGVGVMIQRFVGIGPRLELNFPKTPVKLWAAPLYDWEQRHFNWLLGFRLSF